MFENLFEIGQIVFADIILSGDNALVIGMAASCLSPVLRKRAIFLGMMLAAVLRIVFASAATMVLHIPGIIFFGGVLLLWVCWRFYVELRDHAVAAAAEDCMDNEYTGSPRRQMWSALITITIADVSMSIDNVVAVAAIARDDTALLVFGLVLAIAFMAFFATMFMRIMTKYPMLSWVGLVFLIYLAGKMLYDGLPGLMALF